MAELKEYRWRGYTWQIADEDLPKYPGAVLVTEPSAKKRQSTPNKSRRAPKTK